jgi:hypothetical protein
MIKINIKANEITCPSTEAELKFEKPVKFKQQDKKIKIVPVFKPSCLNSDNSPMVNITDAAIVI